MISCIYTVPFNIEQVFKLVLFVQYRLLSLPWTHAASLRKNPLCNSWLCRYSLLISKCLRDHVLHLAQFQVVSTCVIFTRSQISHMTYHMTFIDFRTNHVTSHMINPDTWHPTSAFPLWNTDTITTLGRLPNQDVGSTSYLGSTPVWKLQNQDDWKTWWPDCDTSGDNLSNSFTDADSALHIAILLNNIWPAATDKDNFRNAVKVKGG